MSKELRQHIFSELFLHEVLTLHYEHKLHLYTALEHAFFIVIKNPFFVSWNNMISADEFTFKRFSLYRSDMLAIFSTLPISDRYRIK